MGLRPATLETLADYWATWLGCEPAALSGEGVTVLPARWPSDRHVRVLVRDAATVVVAPAALVDHVETRAGALASLDGRDPDRVTRALELDPGRVLGPQFVGYADRSTLRAVEVRGVRPLERRDADALADLRAACPADEWSGRVGGFAVEEHAVVRGRFVDGDLVAVAACGEDDAVAGVGVIVHPEFRRRGHGSAVVAGVARAAIERGLVPEYRTHETWTASLELARGVGFERYATSVVLAPGAGGWQVGTDPTR